MSATANPASSNFPNLSASGGRAIVKLCLSGDTLILRGRPFNNSPAPEFVLSLASCLAPRLGNKNGEQTDEEWAWQSREFLRMLAVGKEVVYKVDYSSSNRHIGTANLAVAIEGETNISRLIVKHGWVTLKQSKHPNEEQQELYQLESMAQARHIGIWQDMAPEPRVVSQTWAQNIDQRAFLNKMKGMPIPAIVDQVRDASSFRILLMIDENTHQYVNLSLSGIQAPVVRKNVPKMDDLVEPFAEEAKFFVESRLLQKNVGVLLDSISGQGFNISFYGTLVHPAGNISKILLGEGLARIVDWNLNVVADAAAYRAAEQSAKTKGLKMWKNGGAANLASLNHPNNQNGAAVSDTFQATVIKILGADMLLVEPLRAPGTERKLFLASIKGPKKMKNELGMDVGYFLDAQEFLRGRLIGAKITVKIDYVKPAEGDWEKRECATILKNDKNIGAIMVKQGLAGVLKHRKDDNNRSSSYDALLSAEEEAQAAEIGIHSKAELPIHRIVDASESVAKAKSFLAQLQRNASMKGIVEYIWSGSRFKIYLPAQNCRVSFILAGLKCPRPPSANQKILEPFGLEALSFATKRVFQREVEITVEGQDKVGGFLGTLTIGDSNLGVSLVEAGLSNLHYSSASASPSGPLLFAAEARAKEERLRLWENYKPEDDIVEELEHLKLSADTSDREAIVSEISKDGKQLYIQFIGPELNDLDSLMKEFATHHQLVGQQFMVPFIAKAGDYCSAQFSSDKQWYRAQIVKADGENNAYHVLYIDYGNSEVVQGSRLRPLPAVFNLSQLKAQACPVTLAHIEMPSIPPTTDEFAKEAFSALCHFTEGKIFNVKILPGPTKNSLAAMLFSKNGESVQEQLLREGLAFVSLRSYKKYQYDERIRVKNARITVTNTSSSTPTSKSDLEILIEAQIQATRERLNLWENGDLGLYDEE